MFDSLLKKYLEQGEEEVVAFQLAEYEMAKSGEEYYV